MIGGQLHDEGRRITGKQLGLLQDDAGDDDGRHADEVGGDRHQGGLVEQGAGDHADDGHLGAAGDEAGGHNRHPAVPLVLDGPGGHDAGNAAAGAYQHGDEALAGEAELPEDPVHNEGNPGHVADVLQNGQHQEEHQHLGHEAQHRAHARQSAVADQAGQDFIDAPALQGGPGDFHQPGGAQHVVGPVGEEGAEGTHGDPVHREHHHGEDGQGQDAVGDDLVDLVRGREAVLLPLLLDCLAHQTVDVRIPLVGDDALGVIVQLLLAIHNVVFQMGPEVGAQVQIRQHLLVPFKDLHRVPAEIPFVHHALDGLLNVGDGVLHAAGKHVGQFPGALLLGHPGGQLRGLHAALALQCADLHHLAAQGIAEFSGVDLVAVLADQVHHVHRYHYGQAQFDQLGGEVQVPLDVGAVHDVQNPVRLLLHQVVPGHHFLQGVRGQGVNARQVLNDHVLVTFQPALLLFHRDAGPVAHVLVGAGQIVEQRGLAAVRIAGQCDFQFHLDAPF